VGWGALASVLLDCDQAQYCAGGSCEGSGQKKRFKLASALRSLAQYLANLRTVCPILDRPLLDKRKCTGRLDPFFWQVPSYRVLCVRTMDACIPVSSREAFSGRNEYVLYCTCHFCDLGVIQTITLGKVEFLCIHSLPEERNQNPLNTN